MQLLNAYLKIFIPWEDMVKVASKLMFRIRKWIPIQTNSQEPFYTLKAYGVLLEVLYCTVYHHIDNNAHSTIKSIIEIYSAYVYANDLIDFMCV